jgi:hypothetical protein
MEANAEVTRKQFVEEDSYIFVLHEFISDPCHNAPWTIAFFNEESQTEDSY